MLGYVTGLMYLPFRHTVNLRFLFLLTWFQAVVWNIWNMLHCRLCQLRLLSIALADSLDVLMLVSTDFNW